MLTFRYLDYGEDEGVDSEEEEEIRRQMEEQEEAENAPDLDAGDMPDPEPGIGGVAGRARGMGESGMAGMSWPAPR
jgi:hypothetical protein